MITDEIRMGWSLGQAYHSITSHDESLVLFFLLMITVITANSQQLLGGTVTVTGFVRL